MSPRRERRRRIFAASRGVAKHRQQMLASVVAPDGARMRLAAMVAALRRPSSWPGEVLSVEAIETHMSWVFLTATRAYKLKKPIRTGELDHTTIEKRRGACDTEVRLNRRLAPDVYLDAVPVVAVDGGVKVGGAGIPVEWLVEMRRLPRERMLDACIARGAVEAADVARLADALGAFYRRAERAVVSPSSYVARIAADMRAKSASLARPRYGLDASAIESVLGAQRRWLAEHGELLGARAGAVVDAHGDLRPEHVCLEPIPVVIDCLEFSRELRLLDPISELSFLTLECRRLGAGWIGESLIAACGPADPRLVAFYQSQHAVVRAAVAVWHLDDDALERVDSWPQRATWYLNTARGLL